MPAPEYLHGFHGEEKRREELLLQLTLSGKDLETLPKSRIKLNGEASSKLQIARAVNDIASHIDL